MSSFASTRLLMRAIRVAQFGGPDVLKVDSNTPVPVPGPTQVLVQVKAAGINPVDTYIRTGTYALKPALPYTPGSDASGIVKEVGADVTKFKPGDRVFVLKSTTGSYAEYTTSEESMTGLLSPELSFQQGAGIGVPCFTAYRALFIKGKEKAKSGNTVLIHGASGAVGQACVQMAAAAGIQVIGTAGSQEGQDKIKQLGATAAFNHREPGYVDQIMAATGGKGPDLILEMLANVNLQTDLTLIRQNGVIVVVGNRGTIEVNPRLAMQKECVVTGLILMNSSQEEWIEMNRRITELTHTGVLEPHICQEYSLEEAPQAHRDVINSTATLGKRVLVV